MERDGEARGQAQDHAADQGRAAAAQDAVIAPSEEAAAGERPAAYTAYRRPHRRRYQSALDMVFSLGAVAVAVAVILAVTWRPKPDPIRVVDASPAITDVRLLVSWPVVNPSSGLPDGWRMTVARRDFTVASAPVLALGWVTPSGHWVGLQQTGAQGRDADRWRGSFLPDDWRSGVAYRGGQWRKFANLRACPSPCAVSKAPLMYAQRVATAATDSADARATYIVYGEAPSDEIDAVMKAVDGALAATSGSS
jgi:hypothetical protein